MNTQNTTNRNVLIVDDSTVIQNHTYRLIKNLSNVGEIFIASNGVEAIEQAQKHHIDIVILDIQMPLKDGIETLPELLNINPKVKVIISSTLSLNGATITLKALSLGAYDYVTKPSPAISGYTLTDFERDLTHKIQNVISTISISNTATRRQPSYLLQGQNSAPSEYKPLIPRANAIVIGSSTGGPTALLQLFQSMPPKINIPIFIVQHMPPIFTAMLAENIQRASGITTIEVQETQNVAPNTIYLAPGGYHLELFRPKADIMLQLTSNPPENFCRPSVNPLFRSAAQIYGNKLLGFILTGMGQDGLEGSKDIVRLGGSIIAQDESSSTVWGMPKAVSDEGLATNILSLNEIKQLIHKYVVQP